MGERSGIPLGTLLSVVAASSAHHPHRLGRCMTHNLADYHIPAHADVPEIDVIFVDEPDAQVSPLGVKKSRDRYRRDRGGGRQCHLSCDR